MGEHGAPMAGLRAGIGRGPRRSEDLSDPTLCCRARGGYSDRCDLLLGLDGLHAIGVDREDGGALTVAVESAADVVDCPTCGVLAHAHGGVEVHWVDAPAMGAPVRIVWRKPRWVCPDGHCPVRSFVEQDEAIAAAGPG